MAIAIDATTQGSIAGAASLTISHTVGSGSDRVLYVFVMGQNSTDLMASGTVTYGGTSMGSPLQSVLELGNGSNFMRVFRMTAPTSGTANVVITPSASAYIHAYCVSLTGVDQTTPEGTINTSPASGPAATSDTPISTTVTLGTDGMAIDMLTRRAASSSLTPDASQTRLGTEQTGGAIATSGCSYKTGSGSTTMTWTHAGVGNLSHLVVPVNAAAGGGYTLNCDQGSYTLTGQAAGTKVGRKLAAGQGTYTLTGSAASLLEGHVITCEQGSYTLTGSTAYADYAITCASGSYTLSGQAAGAKAARKLAAVQGSYTLTGQDVALLYTTPGAYSLAMGQGTYTLTGQAAALQAARRIVAEQGLYALSGQAAALRLGRKVALAVGSYSLTGQDIAFDAPARLAAAAGSYALTGQAVTLTYAGAPVAAVLSAPPSGRRLQGYGRPANIQRSTR